MSKSKPFDFGLFIVILLLLTGGIIMISSASPVYAEQHFNNSNYFLIKQLSWAGLGIAIMLFVSNINYKIWGKLSKLIFLISLVLLVLVLIPHIGVVKNYARRWIDLGFTEFQPSEVVKISSIMFFSYKLSRCKEELKSFWGGFMTFLLMPAIIAVLLLKEPHMSAAALILMVSLIILFVAGAKMSHFAAIALPGFAAAMAAIIYEPYRFKRLTTFLNPWSDPKGAGWQVIQSLYAIGSGGLFGLGLGRSRQKFLYIPEPHNDFIFSVLAEEVGYIGVVAVLILFLIFIWRGFKIAMNAPDAFGSLMAVGITSLVAIQVFINVLVVTSSMPATGMPLPFFSYGGSSLLFLLFGMGILLNISKSANINGS